MALLPDEKVPMSDLSPYAWPGGYPKFWIIRENREILLLCKDCISEKHKVAKVYINWESEDLYCDFCNHRIEKAYES